MGPSSFTFPDLLGAGGLQIKDCWDPSYLQYKQWQREVIPSPDGGAWVSMEAPEWDCLDLKPPTAFY